MSGLLTIADLHTEFPTRRGTVRAVDGVSLHVDAGERVGVVGESGCGKTTLALSLLGLIPPPGRIRSGCIHFEGDDLLQMNDDELRQVRGARLAMSFQDPMTSLNPLTKVGDQIEEAMRAHHRFSRREATQRVVPLMERVHIPDARHRTVDYPHEFSGGMRQRLMLAMATANEPSLLVADEPTTALDVSTQAEIVGLLKELNAHLGMAIMLITHDMALVASLCDRVVVMYAGRVVEEGPAHEIFAHPEHPYTWHLLRSVPRPDAPSRQRLVDIDGRPPDLSELPSGCTFHPRCAFREDRCRDDEPPLEPVRAGQRASCWVLMRNVSHTAARLAATDNSPTPPPDGHDNPQSATEGPTQADRCDESPAAPILEVVEIAKHFPSAGSGPIRAVDGVSFQLRKGETLGLIGESGCGKSTLARVITQLIPATSGRVLFEGRDLTRLHRRELRQARTNLQIVFQDPFSALNPRLSVGELIAEPLRNLGIKRAARRRHVAKLLSTVGLDPSHADRYPHEFSGGQRQRIGIARALSPDPSVLVCDEPVSSLDVSVQAQLINLLKRLQHDLGLSSIFIAHDLGVIRHVSDRVAVMYLGRIVEVAPVRELFDHPQHPYTEALLRCVPIPDPTLEDRRQGAGLRGEVPSAADPPPGCRFHPRCPIARAPGICHDEDPLLRGHGRSGHQAACHFPDEVSTPLYASPRT